MKRKSSKPRNPRPPEAADGFAVKIAGREWTFLMGSIEADAPVVTIDRDKGVVRVDCNCGPTADIIRGVVEAVAKLAEPPAAEPGSGLEHWPHLAEWEIDPTRNFNGHTFPIHETNEDKTLLGRLVVNLEVNPLYDTKSASRIAQLVACAPEMWRALREMARFCFADEGRADEMGEVFELLFDAASHPPFQPPVDHCDDDHYRERMALGLREGDHLGDARKRAAAQAATREGGGHPTKRGA